MLGFDGGVVVDLWGVLVAFSELNLESVGTDPPGWGGTVVRDASWKRSTPIRRTARKRSSVAISVLTRSGTSS